MKDAQPSASPRALLLVSPEQVHDVLMFGVEAKLGVRFIDTRSEADAIGYIVSGKAIDLVVVDAAMDWSKLLGFARDRATPCDVIEVRSESDRPLELPPNWKVFERVPRVRMLESVSVAVGNWLETRDRSAAQPDAAPTESLDAQYCRIRTRVLIQLSPLQNDVYIRLSAQKFLRLFLAGDSFETEDLEKYLNRKRIEFLYLKKNETQEFLQKLEGHLAAILANPDRTPALSIDAAVSALDVVREVSARIGFTPEVQALFKKNVEVLVDLASRQPQVFELLARIDANPASIIATHSSMLALVACAIAEELDWKSDVTFQKLTVAAMLHDLTLPCDEMASFCSYADLDALRDAYTADQANAFYRHADDAAQLVLSLPDLQAEVDVMIRQHHDRPDGSGFPLINDAAKPSPLPSVFILAHEVIDEMFRQRRQFSLDEFIQSRTETYESGNFRKALQGLRKAKIRFGDQIPAKL